MVFFAFWFAGISAIAGMSQQIPAGDTGAQRRQADHQQRFALGCSAGSVPAAPRWRRRRCGGYGGPPAPAPDPEPHRPSNGLTTSDICMLL
ncbi:hypothetical protein [Actinoplanes nipponensis]|uniref:hypothetical protein n=1 Tax=Actinoplanes nipponensis TaxID=135950 RepID=UPI0031F0BAAF